MMWGWNDGSWWMMGIWLLFWVVVIGLAVWLILRSMGRDRASRPSEAEEILRRRFASGEIDADEYARRLEVLRHGDQLPRSGG
jgi:putative membrane protein